MILSAIDNLIKGASGQAVQNMNLLYNLNEKIGLDKTIITKYEDNFKNEIVAYGLRNVWQFYEYEELK